MKPFWMLLFGGVAPLAIAAGQCSNEDPYGIETRVPNTTCIIERFAEAPPPLQLQRAFSSLTFSAPVYVTAPPDTTNRLFVVEKKGVIKVFVNQESTTSAPVFMDISSRVYASASETGLLGLAFHPKFSTNGYFYLNYTADNPLRTVVSRFKITSDPNKGDSASELKLLEINQPYANHNGGMIAFGPDGYLYIGMGDGGSGGDPEGNGQNTKTLLGDMLRIDVDKPANGLNYGIPADNPFASSTNGDRGEIFAWGMRNPWRYSFDRLTGRLWVADVGQDAWEEVDIVEKGKNYGWNRMEGTHCYSPSTGCDTTGLTPPVLEYPHSDGESITGGYVYRGAALPDLYGKYLYADYTNGRIWAATYDGTAIIQNDLVVDSDAAIASFGEDQAGEVYVVDYGGRLYRFVASSGPVAGTFPATLTETGCFSDVANRVPAPGVIPYDVNSPLYADYAKKTRWLALPGTTQLTYASTGAWGFPDGSITLKDFYIEQVEGDAATKRLLETRLMLKLNGTWRGYTYKWNDAQTEAYLLEQSEQQTYGIETAQGPVNYTHYYPSRTDCQTCHTVASGYALGLQTGQMNRDFDYGDVTDNQLRTYDHIALFNSDVPGPYEEYPAFPDPADASQPLELRARSYLHANCAHCHLPGGTASSTLDTRYETSLEAMNACDVPPSQGDLGVVGAMLIKPGAPEKSMVNVRMHVTGEGRMPPLASSVPDPLGTSVSDDWVRALTACP